jgi:hypothetical protein
MPENQISNSDDLWTVIAVAGLAAMSQSFVHEGCGHGLVAWLSGAHFVTVTTVAANADINSRWILAAGTAANLTAGLTCWLMLRWKGYAPVVRYFLVIAMTGNLLSAGGYFAFSGFVKFGDWGQFIRHLKPQWGWRGGLIVLGVAMYSTAMRIAVKELKAFRRKEIPGRIRNLAVTPYFTEGIVGVLGGLLNPVGWFYVVASALPATMGGNVGMLYFPGLANRDGGDDGDVGLIRRDWRWIAAACAGLIVFVFVLGRGITWRR